MADWNELVMFFEKDGLNLAKEKEIIYPEIYSIIEEYEKLVVLDFGSGIGRFCYAITDFCTKVTGVDSSKKMVEHANKNYTDKGIKFTTDSIYDMRIKKYNFMTALFSFQYLDNSEFTKMMDIIANSKVEELIIVNDNFEYIKRCIDKNVGPFSLQKGQYYNAIARRRFKMYPRSIDFLKKTFKSYGFTLIQQEKLKYPTHFHEKYAELRDMPKGIAAFNLLHFRRDE